MYRPHRTNYPGFLNKLLHLVQYLTSRRCRSGPKDRRLQTAKRLEYLAPHRYDFLAQFAKRASPSPGRFRQRYCQKQVLR